MKKRSPSPKQSAGDLVNKPAPAGRRKATGAAAPAAKRDNVLGRRPSKADPLGEQPGTLPAEKNAPIENEKDPDLRRPEDQVTNADMTDRPIGGM